MRNFPLIILFLTSMSGIASAAAPDSVYLFSFASKARNNTVGLQFAWSQDRITWHLIGHEFGFVKSDYGRWGSEKKMIDPYLIQDNNGQWQCVWTLNNREKVFAHASSPDLVEWGRQTYPMLQQGNVFTNAVLSTGKNKAFVITYKDSDDQYYSATTSDFRVFTFAAAQKAPDARQLISIGGEEQKGQVHRVSWKLVENMIRHFDLVRSRHRLYGENTSMYSSLFPDLKPVESSLQVSAKNSKPISDLLVGVFFEDINYAADGGLYAELIQNRDFEYSLSDREGRDKNWNNTSVWSVDGKATFSIDTINPIHPNNPHYAVVKSNGGGTLRNEGFDGIVLRKGQQYNFSCFAKLLAGKNECTVKLIRENGEEITRQKFSIKSSSWKKYSVVLAPAYDENHATLALEFSSDAVTGVDLISLFPRNTFKGRKNGLRNDLATSIAELHPRFVRFPGGCVAHGDGIENIYHWKNSIGPLEARKPQRNLWGYHQTVGLGYFEYFQFCEDIGAEPVPVVAAGVPCQNSGVGGGGQQGGIPMDQMDEYVQDVLDLIEFANGDPKSTWGKKRAEAGHPKPFNLKYVGIGNEDLITDVFEERFTMIYNAVKKRYPEVTVIGTVGPYSEGTDYREGWKLADKLSVPMVDEHYYQSPGWFIYNQDYYDSYDRTKSKVYLGEYAAHLPGRPNNLETALSEAIYLTSLERNGDVVTMASYAPLLAKEGHTQWNPDMIYFDNASVKITPGYYVQKLFSEHAGDEYIFAATDVKHRDAAVKNRISTSVVKDRETGDVIVKIVNLLPVQSRMSLDLTGLISDTSPARKIVLQGSPDDKNSLPKEESITFSKDASYDVPPFSFTVIRVLVKK